MATVDPSKSFALPKFDHRILDLTGQRFTRLVVVKFAGRDSKNCVLWECLCDCGRTTIAPSFSLRNKELRSRKRSCGCLGGDVTRERSFTHGMRSSPEYSSWRSMKHRCLYKNATGYENYGGRGITICERWLHSFENFFEDMGKRPSLLYELDRVDNEGNYEPSNCKWSTVKEQANNRRQPKPRLLLTFNGESLTIAQWAKKLGLEEGTIHSRRWKRMPIDKVLSVDLRKCRHVRPRH